MPLRSLTRPIERSSRSQRSVAFFAPFQHGLVSLLGVGDLEHQVVQLAPFILYGEYHLHPFL